MCDNSNMTTTQQQKGNVMKHLGTMNGWGNNKPAEYVKHLAECGKEVTREIFVMNKPTMKTFRVYNVTSKGSNCWHTETCHDCGCSWSIDSSG